MNKIIFREVTRFTFDLDLDEDMGHTRRAALLTGVIQAGGQESDISQYRLTAFADGEPRLTDWAAGPEFQPTGDLADFSDEQLVSELLWRLQNRTLWCGRGRRHQPEPGAPDHQPSSWLARTTRTARPA